MSEKEEQTDWTAGWLVGWYCLLVSPTQHTGSGGRNTNTHTHAGARLCLNEPYTVWPKRVNGGPTNTGRITSKWMEWKPLIRTQQGLTVLVVGTLERMDGTVFELEEVFAFLNS